MGEEEFRPSWWFVVAFGVGVGLLAYILGLVLGSGSSVPIGGALGGGMAARYWVFTVSLGPQGFSMNGRTVSWDQAVLRRGWTGATELRGASDVPRRQRVAVVLPMYERRWREGRFGRAMAQWAPHLLHDVPGGR